MSGDYVVPADGVARPDTSEVEREQERLKAEFDAAINELRLQYQNEQKSKAKLQEEYMELKNQYEKAVESIENDHSLDPWEAKKRLQILEKQFVGGEQVGLSNDRFLLIFNKDSL